MLLHVFSHLIPTAALEGYPLFQYVKNKAPNDGKPEILLKSIGPQTHYFPRIVSPWIISLTGFMDLGKLFHLS